MLEELSKSLKPNDVAILIAALLYIIKITWEFVSRNLLKNKDKLDENTQAVRELIIKIDHLNNRLVAIELSVDKLEEFKHLAWKNEKDITFAHEKIREMKDELNQR
jgi:hypothetical protein